MEYSATDNAELATHEQLDPDNSSESPMTRDTQKAKTKTMLRYFISWAMGHDFLGNEFGAS